MGAAWFAVFAVVMPLGLAATIGLAVGIAHNGEDRIMLDTVQGCSLGLTAVGVLLAALMAIFGTKFRKLSGTELESHDISDASVEWMQSSLNQLLKNASVSNATPNQWWFVCFIAIGAALGRLPIEMLFYIAVLLVPVALGVLIFSKKRARIAVCGMFVGLFLGIGCWMMFGVD
jgi:hypothetical protein